MCGLSPAVSQRATLDGRLRELGLEGGALEACAAVATLDGVMGELGGELEFRH